MSDGIQVVQVVFGVMVVVAVFYHQVVRFYRLRWHNGKLTTEKGYKNDGTSLIRKLIAVQFAVEYLVVFLFLIVGYSLVFSLLAALAGALVLNILHNGPTLFELIREHSRCQRAANREQEEQPAEQQKEST